MRSSCWQTSRKMVTARFKIFVGLEEKCRERITNGLKSCITSDNNTAVEVDHLRRGRPATLQGREAENE